MIQSSTPTKVLIISESHITRSGIRAILESHDTIQVVGEASATSPPLADPLFRLHPDVIVLDLHTSTLDPFAPIRSLKRLAKSVVVTLLCDLRDGEIARKGLSFGAAGVILKTQPPSVMIAGIQSMRWAGKHADTGGRPCEEPLQKTITETVACSPPLVTNISSLTAREHAIIRLIALGLKNKEIANQLCISDITVRHHLSNIFRKLQVSSRQKLLILAHQQSITSLAHTQNAV